MRKTISVLLAILLTVTVFASGGAADNDPVTIQFWHWYGAAFQKNFEREALLFQQQHPNIVVEVTSIPDQGAYRETLASAFASDQAPDVFSRRHTISSMIENGWISPLDAYIDEEWIAQFPEDSFRPGCNMVDGKIYSFPNNALKFDRMLYINEDLFRQAGLVDGGGNVIYPKTWDELRTMAAAITQAGKGEYYGMGLGIKDPKTFGHWLDLAGLAGGPISDGFDFRTGRYSFGSDPAYGRIVELLLGMKSDGSVFPSEGSLDDNNQYLYFGQGKFAMMMSGVYAVANLLNDFPEIENIRAIPLPEPPEGRTGGLWVTRGFGMYLLSAKSEHPQEAWLWLDWMASKGYGERYVQNGLDFSVHTEVNTPENVGEGLRAEAYAAATAYLVRPPYPPADNIDAQQVLPEAITSEPDAGDILVGIYTGQIVDWKQALVDLDARKQAALDGAIQEANQQGFQISLEDYIYPAFNPMEDYVQE